ncbi:hypothetical protein Btru_027162, partial [Bulinus truncatus]
LTKYMTHSALDTTGLLIQRRHGLAVKIIMLNPTVACGHWRKVIVHRVGDVDKLQQACSGSDKQLLRKADPLFHYKEFMWCIITAHVKCLYCTAYHDSFQCWPDTAANSTVYRPCPDSTNQDAFRVCTEGGTWETNETNYMACLDSEDYTNVSGQLHYLTNGRVVFVVGYNITTSLDDFPNPRSLYKTKRYVSSDCGVTGQWVISLDIPDTIVKPCT